VWRWLANQLVYAYATHRHDVMDARPHPRAQAPQGATRLRLAGPPALAAPLALAVPFALIMLLGSSVAAIAQEPGRRIHALSIPGPIRVDGVLDDAAWAQAEMISEFTQQDPREGEPATERTEVRILLSPSTLYIGVMCFDAQPDRIVARERRRDNDLRNDDRFEVVLDTFHDRRNGFYFVTNPLGTRFDALITDEGVDINSEWDERWWVESKVSETGWSAEFEIPLAILRASRDRDTWGVNFQRFIRRKNEIAFWSGWDRDYTFLQVSQAGTLEGLAGAKTGLRARIKPYLLGAGREAGANRGLHNASEIGIEVAKVGITPSLTAEFTVNPDFAQVEVDDAVVNLTRFPVFFPERREFFLERAGIFDFSIGGRRGGQSERLLQMFFPRRIGLTTDRRPLPVLAGAKVTGRVGGVDLGVLNVQTNEFEGRPADNYSVVRVKKNILARSNVGAFITNRQSGAANDRNSFAGAESNFSLLKNTELHASLGRAFTQGATGDQMMGRLKFDRFTEKYELFAEHLYIGDDFRHDLGYVQRNGVRRSNAIVTWDPRPDVLNIRRLAVKSEIAYVTDTNNRLESRLQNIQLRTHFQTGASTRVAANDNFERLDAPFRITPTITIPPGDYRYTDFLFEAGGRPDAVVVPFITSGIGDFYDGSRKYIELRPSFRPGSRFAADLSYQYNVVDLPAGSFRTRVLNSRVNLNLTNRWLTTALVQHDSASETVVLFLRLRFNYRPGDDLFVVLNQTSSVGERTAPTDRAIMVKLTRSFEF
jgi:hypothetical protein